MDLGTIHQWCRTCEACTETWIDEYGNSRCAGHESPDDDDWDDD